MSAVAVAAALDIVAGEPSDSTHPVVWMGRYLDRVGRRLPAVPAARAGVVGAVAWATGAAGCAAAGALVQRAVRNRSPLARAAVVGMTLWTLGSGRMLLTEVAAVEKALGHTVDAGRERLDRLVSRDTDRLTAEDVRASALESLAENLSDSVVAPVFWYCVGGLPAAAAYRFTNTADAMWGYRTPRWEHAGKAVARADDVLNLVPARVTAALLLAVAGAPPGRWARLPAQARNTTSPNGGWPMGALALALGIRLPKPGHYVLNETGRPPGPADTRAALDLAVRTAAVVVVLATCAERRGLRRRDTRPERPAQHLRRKP